MKLAPDLVFTGEGTFARNSGLESQHRILDRHFFTIIRVKTCFLYFKKTQKKRKRCPEWSIKKRQISSQNSFPFTLSHTETKIFSLRINLRVKADCKLAHHGSANKLKNFIFAKVQEAKTLNS